jgi:hypothetical protein
MSFLQEKLAKYLKIKSHRRMGEAWSDLKCVLKQFVQIDLRVGVSSDDAGCSDFELIIHRFVLIKFG